LVVALLVLGPKRLPEVGRTLGNGLRDFRNALNGEPEHHEEIGIPYPDAQPTATPADATPAAEQPIVHETTAPAAEHEFAHQVEPTPAGEHLFAGGDGNNPPDPGEPHS
jgi:sec-independent protein translocase protein TatA